MTRFFLITGAIFGGISVAAGAFGSHALRAILSQPALSTWHTGVQYQMYMAIALLVIGLLRLVGHLSSAWLNRAGIAFVVGGLLFSGSLYGLSFRSLTILGLMTPLGGVAMLLGWFCLAIAAWSLSQ